ncbi:hypothetical protein J1907_14845 [Lysinibacillus sphaericus]|uniref:hypothetical protein n=2 Tax=Lysinibacillus sphaericus TaxID=1421 RepID=UPI000ACAA587|nr:hypothetical protein [Lysinibacillus sphaericus]QTB21062.1 hypothetical protein J1907_14845 [Lysinibacillus sphaericus]
MVKLNLVRCLDIEKSEYRPLLKSLLDGPIKLLTIKYVPHSLEGHHIVRMKEYTGNIIVDELFIKACKEEKIKGVLKTHVYGINPCACVFIVSRNITVY